MAASKYLYTPTLFVDSPIHTSSHYQPFETPHLIELVGGDRNMEQNNLVVTGDGKTWDQVTRDTSYMGPQMFRTSTDTGNSNSVAFSNFDEHRGVRHGRPMAWKYFTYGKDRAICLRNGKYRIHVQTIKIINNTYHLSLIHI